MIELQQLSSSSKQQLYRIRTRILFLDGSSFNAILLLSTPFSSVCTYCCTLNYYCYSAVAAILFYAHNLIGVYVDIFPAK